MSEAKFKEKVDDLIVDMTKLIRDRADKLVKSANRCNKLIEMGKRGDLSDETGTPKMFMCAVADEIKYQYSPASYFF